MPLTARWCKFKFKFKLSRSVKSFNSNQQQPTATNKERALMSEAQRMLATMVALQESHNLQVASDWRTRSLPFQRAIWVECAELLDHFGWKWWKRQAPDLGQVKLELVDIWHFGLSQLMQDGQADEANLADLSSTLVRQLMPAMHTEPALDAAERFRTSVESLALAALQTGSFSVDAFAALMNGLDMSWRELFELYVGKNVLNRFRQDHGYQDGSYRKLWSGREDNVHLLEIVSELDPAHADYLNVLYAALQARYDAA